MSSEKPKILIYSDHLLYPSETFILAQASALSQFQPVFAGCRRVTGLDLTAQQVEVLNRTGSTAGKCRELCFKLTGFGPEFIRRLGALNPVLVHAHYGPNGMRALPIAKHLNIPLVVTIHGSDVTITDLRYHKATLGFRHYLATNRRLKESSGLFLAVSEFIRRKLLDQGFPAERVIVHYTGIDTTRFQPSEQEEERKPLILYVGRLEESKGAEYLVRAAGEVQNQMPEAELVVIGDGSLRPGLELEAKKRLRRYQFIGSRTSQEVRDWMNRASVICVPSITVRSGEEEGFGMVCAEAQAVGKPVVAFASGAIPEIIAHGQTGFLVTERDTQQLAAHLISLLQNPELRKRMGLAGRERVLQKFDLAQRTRILEGIYQREISAAVKEREFATVGYQSVV